MKTNFFMRVEKYFILPKAKTPTPKAKTPTPKAKTLLNKFVNALDKDELNALKKKVCQP
jgi:hypothetical protein